MRLFDVAIWLECHGRVNGFKSKCRRDVVLAVILLLWKQAGTELEFKAADQAIQLAG